MIHAYDKSYLSAAQKNLARMLDYLVNDLHYPLEMARQWFVTSELSALVCLRPQPGILDRLGSCLLPVADQFALCGD